MPMMGPADTPEQDAVPPLGAGFRPAETEAVTRGVCRLFVSMGFAPLCEMALVNGRRADVVGLGPNGEIVMAEVKSSVEDFRTDAKWTDYLGFCDRFFFAVTERFPAEILPDETGLIVADRFGGAVVRDAPVTKLHASRRKAMTLRYGRMAADRMARLTDPDMLILVP